EQAMLLKAIEEKRFFPLGSDKETRSDFQLIAGTNRDLREAVAAGRFREDLLARINLWTFQLPPLMRARRSSRKRPAATASRRSRFVPAMSWKSLRVSLSEPRGKKRFSSMALSSIACS